MLVAVVDHLGDVEQLAERDDRHDRGALDQPDDLIEGVRQDRPRRLRQDDAQHPGVARQSESRRRLELALVHREDAAADDLRRVRRLVQGEAEHGRRELADQGDGVEAPEIVVGERDAEPESRIEVAEVVPDQQLHEQRHRAEEPDERPGSAAQDGRLRQAGQGQQGAEDEPDRARHRRERQGEAETLEYCRGEEILGEDVPAVRVIRHEGPGELQHEEEHDGAEDPAQVVARVHDREGVEVGRAVVDGLGGCRAGRRAWRHGMVSNCGCHELVTRFRSVGQAGNRRGRP